MTQTRAIATVAGMTAGIALFFAGVAVASPPGPEGHTVTLCHATNSNTNPYVEITVDVASVLNRHGHAGHTGPVWDLSLKGQHISWGDVIPAFTYTAPDGSSQSYPGMNDDGSGAAILGNGCDIPSGRTG